jgi:hypothetical protein
VHPLRCPLLNSLQETKCAEVRAGSTSSIRSRNAVSLAWQVLDRTSGRTLTETCLQPSTSLDRSCQQLASMHTIDLTLVVVVVRLLAALGSGPPSALSASDNAASPANRPVCLLSTSAKSAHSRLPFEEGRPLAYLPVATA